MRSIFLYVKGKYWSTIMTRQLILYNFYDCIECLWETQDIEMIYVWT